MFESLNKRIQLKKNQKITVEATVVVDSKTINVDEKLLIFKKLQIDIDFQLTSKNLIYNINIDVR